MTFAGIRIIKTSYGFMMDQSQYSHSLYALPTCSNFDSFRSLRHKHAFLGHTWPDIIAPVNILSQATAINIEARHIKLLNDVVKRQKSEEGRGHSQHGLDKRRLRLFFFTDALFANNDDRSTHFGYVIILTDDSNKGNVLHC